MIRFTQHDVEFSEIFRIFISGMSSSGKTHFTYNLLKSGLFTFDRVYYFHPDFHETAPVNWSLEKPIIFQAGIPSLSEITSFPRGSVLILDDLYTEASESKDIDYLFRVLSGKKHLNVIIMTQRYFERAKYSLSIRNSSNYHVLMRNSDERTNISVGKMMGLGQDFKAALADNREKLYPYIFIDRTNQARVNNMIIYTDILSKVKIVFRNRMKFYLLTENDFNSTFQIVDNDLAKRKNETAAICSQPKSGESIGESNTAGESSRSRTTPSSLGRISRNRAVERQIKRIIHQHKKRSKL